MKNRSESVSSVVFLITMCFLSAFVTLVGHNVYVRLRGHPGRVIDAEDGSAMYYRQMFGEELGKRSPLPFKSVVRERSQNEQDTVEYYEYLEHEPGQDVEEPSTHEWVAVWAVTTAYSPHAQSCYPYDDGFTSIGINTDINPWGIAACPSVIPYGTRIVVPGYKPSRHFADDYPWSVDDTGADMRRAARRGVIHLDLRYIHQRSAMRYGRHRKVVYIDVSGMNERQRRWVMERSAHE